MDIDHKKKAKSKSEKFWDRQVKVFTDQEQRTQLNENKDFRTTLKYLNIDDTVLDYGCATGIISNAIADKVKGIHAIDISSKMIEIAKRKAGERHIDNIHYAHATIFDEIYQKESFNVILAFRILHMLEDIQEIMHRIHELLKTGGIFISVSACMGDKRSLLSILVFLASKMRIVPQHINYFKLLELQGIITSAGFHIVEYEQMDDNIPHYCIVARKL
ncbi:class I SAM-dependent methyltransferase [Chloroflexota bacterium]